MYINDIKYMKNGQPYLSTNEIAKLFNVRGITIYRWEKQGYIKSYRFNPKGKKMFAKEEILNCIQNNKHFTSSNDIKLLENSNSQEIGTKAKNIKIIKEKGRCLIPKTLVININIFNQLLIHNKISNPISYNWSNFEIPARYQKIIFEKIAQEFGDKPLVIRSSATCEDSPLLSFAGQYLSFLNIKGKNNIMKAIKLCYQSLFSENAKIYAKISGVRLEYESMAIAIQELAPVKVAGVIFTADPVNQDNKKLIIEYTKGLGDSIVSGHKKPKVKTINKKEINNLDDKMLIALVKIALNLEKIFGNPQDIEWGWDGKRIYIFQSRNITTLDKYPKGKNSKFNNKKTIATGIVVCKGIAEGPLKVVRNDKDYENINKGDVVLINCKTSIILIKKIKFINALIINGGVLSHIAVIAREFNIPCLTEIIITNKDIEKYSNNNIVVDAIEGKILRK
jgi:phosphoenolpyruvate synthase/pyruvate phosphate dikinase